MDMIIAEALWDHHGKMKDHLTFKAGDLIEVNLQFNDFSHLRELSTSL